MSQNTKMYRLTVNSRPDDKGLIWFMLERSGEHYAGHVALYLQTNRGAAITMSEHIFAGTNATLTTVIRAVSEWVAHDGRQARFVGTAEDDNSNHDPAVGPALIFDISGQASAADSDSERLAAKLERVRLAATGATTQGKGGWKGRIDAVLDVLEAEEV